VARRALAALLRRVFPDSDVDLLVEFQPGATTTLFDMAPTEIELSALMDGRRMDLRTAADLSRFFRDEVVRTAVPQCVARWPIGLFWCGRRTRLKSP